MEPQKEIHPDEKLINQQIKNEKKPSFGIGLSVSVH